MKLQLLLLSCVCLCLFLIYCVQAQHLFCETPLTTNCVKSKAKSETEEASLLQYNGAFLKDKNFYHGYKRIRKDIFPHGNINDNAYAKQEEAIAVSDMGRERAIPGSMQFGGSSCTTSCEWFGHVTNSGLTAEEAEEETPFCTQCKRPFAEYNKQIGECLDLTLPVNKPYFDSLMKKCSTYGQCKCNYNPKSTKVSFLTKSVKAKRLDLNVIKLKQSSNKRRSIEDSFVKYYNNKETINNRVEYLYATTTQVRATILMDRIVTAQQCEAPFMSIMDFDDILFEELSKKSKDKINKDLITYVEAQRETYLMNLWYMAAIAPPGITRLLKPINSTHYEYRTGQVFGPTSAAEESLISFREDPWIEVTHAQWHSTFPFTSYPYTFNYIESTKHGEMFYYFHNQLVGRYNAERYGHGMDPVTPLKYREKLEGYDDRLYSGPQKLYMKREYGEVIPEVPEPHKGMFNQGKDVFKNSYEKLFSMIRMFKQNGYKPTSKLFANAMSELGSGTQATLYSATSVFEPFHHPEGEGIHNNLHNMLGTLPKTAVFNMDDFHTKGSIIGEDAAMRDPIFFKLHESIEQIFYNMTKTLPTRSIDQLKQENPVSSSRVKISKVGFAKESKQDIDNEIVQHTLKNHVVFSPDVKKFVVVGQVDTLVPSDLIIKLSVSAGAAVPLMFRVYMVPKQWRTNVRPWLELDKFYYSIPSNGNDKEIVIRRSLKQASMVAKPSYGVDPVPRIFSSDVYQCGFPFHKLFPIGSPDGVTYTLLVVATDYSEKENGMSGSDFNHYTTLAAPSICGAHLKGTSCAKREIIDSKPMKYPLDRLGWVSSFDETLKQHANSFIATTEFVIVKK